MTDLTDLAEFDLSGFRCRSELIGSEYSGAPALVLLFSGFDRELFGEVCGLLSQARCRPLVLAEFAEFGGIDWDRDYTPWEAEGYQGRKFSGGADRLLRFIPEFIAELRRRYCSSDDFTGAYLCGYSLGGLFALYAAAMSEPGSFSGAASCSGSMWFPGWTEFLRNHPLHGRIYLSLGGKEKNSPDPLMASVGEKTRETERIAGRTAEVIFRQEAGGHFSKIPQRISRAVLALIE